MSEITGQIANFSLGNFDHLWRQIKKKTFIIIYVHICTYFFKHEPWVSKSQSDPLATSLSKYGLSSSK